MFRQRVQTDRQTESTDRQTDGQKHRDMYRKNEAKLEQAVTVSSARKFAKGANLFIFIDRFKERVIYLVFV